MQAGAAPKEPGPSSPTPKGERPVTGEPNPLFPSSPHRQHRSRTPTPHAIDLPGRHVRRDGLTDWARIRNGEVCYGPNLGYGRFGAKVTMHWKLSALVGRGCGPVWKRSLRAGARTQPSAVGRGRERRSAGRQAGSGVPRANLALLRSFRHTSFPCDAQIVKGVAAPLFLAHE